MTVLPKFQMAFLSSLLCTLLFSLLCILLFALFAIRVLTSAKLNDGNGPKTYPIIGCLLSFYENKHRLLDWYTDLLAESKSQTIIISRLGARRMVVTANPENIEHMLKTNFRNYPKGKAFTELLGDLLGFGIFNADGELWHSQRKLASYEFSARNIRDFTEAVLESEVNQRLLPLLSSACEDGKLVDMQDLLRRFAFDTISRVSLGVDPGCLEPSLPDSEFAKAFEVAGAISAQRGAAVVPTVWKLKRALGIGSEKILKEKVQTIHSSIEDLIRNKQNQLQSSSSGGSTGNDFLSRLASGGHEEVVVRDMVISFVMAGRDTTSSALTWLFWLLSRHLSIQEEVVREVTRVPRGDYGSLREMKLLEACILETMRLYPPVAWDSKHAACRDVFPDGTVVEKGDRVTFFPYGMGRMEAVWGKTAGEFDPRRWLGKEGITKVSAFKYPVFQAGPRVCLGKDMAFTQMKYVAAAVLRRFKLRPMLSEEEKPGFLPLLTAHMAGGLNVEVSEREMPAL